MNKDYLQNIRYKLQKRVAYLKSCKPNMFHAVLKRFWNFVENEYILKGIIEDLKTKYPEISKIADEYLDPNAELIDILNTEEENAALCFQILEKLAKEDDLDNEETARIGWNFIGRTNFDEGYEAFYDFIIDPFCEYLDESLDDSKAILAYLLKYKQRTEWFHNNRLFEMWTNNTQQGEISLAKDLYEYLFDQGIDFYIEPSSAVGRVDLIESQTGKDRLIADVKIFNPEQSKGVSYISKGFNQVYTYTHSYNQPIGYMIIFKTCENDLQFSLKDQDSEFKYVNYNNKTIFFLTIDIFNYEKSASKRGTLKTETIREEDLIQAVEIQPNLQSL